MQVQYLLQGGGLSEERELRRRTVDNNNLSVLNNFNVGTYRELNGKLQKLKESLINYRD